jgi:hypothetical protein
MSSFGLEAGIDQRLKALTTRGMNVYKPSSRNLRNSQTLAAEFIRQNK